MFYASCGLLTVREGKVNEVIWPRQYKTDEGSGKKKIGKILKAREEEASERI